MSLVYGLFCLSEFSPSQGVCGDQLDLYEGAVDFCDTSLIKSSPVPTTNVLSDLAIRAEFSKAHLVALILPSPDFAEALTFEGAFSSTRNPTGDNKFRPVSNKHPATDSRPILDAAFVSVDVEGKPAGVVTQSFSQSPLRALGPLLLVPSILAYTQGSRLRKFEDGGFGSFPLNIA